jgi:hypothetical protein
MPERKHYMRPYSVVARKDTYLGIKLTVIGPGKMVGEDELIRGCTHLENCTRVISYTAKLYRLKKDVIRYSL